MIARRHPETPAPVADLLADLSRRGIRLQPAGDRLRFHPRSAVTEDLARRLKAHKADLLAALNAKTHYRERVKAALLSVHRIDPDLMQSLLDSWKERIALLEAEGTDPIEVERVACEQVEAGVGQVEVEPVDEWVEGVIRDDLSRHEGRSR